MCTITTIIERRGYSIPEKQRELVESLRQQAFEVQRRFELAEQTAQLLEEMFNPETAVAEAIDDTYEANAFVSLRIQLFRLLIVNI